MCAEVEYLTLSTFVRYLVADVCAPSYQTVCNPVALPVELENMRPPCEDAQRLKGEGVKTPRPNSLLLQETPSRTVASGRTPRNDLVSCSQSAKTERK